MKIKTSIISMLAFAILIGIAFPKGDRSSVAGLGDAATGKSFILRAGILYTGDTAPVRDASVVVRDGRIEFIRTGSADLPNDLPVVDRLDSIVAPGFVASETSLSDAFEERFPNPQFGTYITFRTVDPLRRAIDGFSFLERRDALLASGVTSAYLAPGQKRLVNGRGAVIKLAGANPGDRTLREISDLSISIGDAPKNPPSEFEAKVPPSAENPVEPAKPQMPKTRAGAAYAIRESFDFAIANFKLSKDAKTPRTSPPFNPESVALAELLTAKQRIRIRTNSSADARTALQLFADYGLSGAIVGAAESDAFAAQLKESDIAAIVEIPFIAGALPNVNSRAETPQGAARTASNLAAAGVRVAISAADDTQLASWPLLMAAASRGGMSRIDIVRACTSEPAKILGVAERIGTLAAGRDADFVILNGEPGEPTTTVRETWVNGKKVFDRVEIDARRRESKKLEITGGAVVVRAGLIYTMGGDAIQNGAVSILNGKIVAVGHDVPVPRGARVIDAGPNAVVTPGLIDSRSFLGLEGDPTGFVGNVNLQLLAVPMSPDFRAVARSGVTTVLVQGASPMVPGTPIAALKTGGAQNQLIIREVCGIVIPSQGPSPEGYKALIRRGKDYSDKWDKYFVDFDKYKDDVKKGLVDTKKADEKADTKKEEPAKPEESDPVTGTWEGDISGGPLPRKEQITLKLKLKGDAVSGSFSSRSPLARGEIEFEGGKFKDNTITITITRPDIPVPLHIEAKIDRPDHLTGKVDAQMFQFDLEANRTEKAAPSFTVKSKTKKKGGPEMPPADETLEPYRRLLKNDAALVVRAESKLEIEGAIAGVADEFKIQLVILGGGDSYEIAPSMAAKKIGFITGPNLAASRSESGLPLVTELAAAGVPVAIGSESGTGASRFVDFGAYAVSRGVGSETALRALTVDPARLFKIDQRVGSLEPGKDGDLVIWTGMPFRGSSEIRTVIIGGMVVSGGDASGEQK
ncbi:MAG: amidohydrolase family protein [Planctomycetes bacterium]|nr:amidohydrolase family protein [Planctomycetota bacterium]